MKVRALISRAEVYLLERARRLAGHLVTWLESGGLVVDTVESPVTWACNAARTRADRMEREAMLADLYAQSLKVEVVEEMARNLMRQEIEAQNRAVAEGKVSRLGRRFGGHPRRS